MALFKMMAKPLAVSVPAIAQVNVEVQQLLNDEKKAWSIQPYSVV